MSGHQPSPWTTASHRCSCDSPLTLASLKPRRSMLSKPISSSSRHTSSALKRARCFFRSSSLSTYRAVANDERVIMEIGCLLHCMYFL